MPTKHTFFFSILFILNVSFNAIAAQNYCTLVELTPSNLEETIDLIEVYYDEELFDMENFPTTDVAMDNLRTFLESEIRETQIGDDCDPGHFFYSGYQQETLNEYTLFFRWNTDSLEDGYAYNAKLYEFDLDQSSYFDSDNPSGNFIISNGLPLGKLILLNTFCPTKGQSKTYLLIIIEKDLSFIGINKACHPEIEYEDPTVEPDPIPVTPVPRLQNIKATKFSIYPNPIIHSNISLDFDLPVEQKISIHVIEANSGKKISQICNRKSFESGSHNLSIPADQFASGLYYFVLQTDSERLMQKLIKI